MNEVTGQGEPLTAEAVDSWLGTCDPKAPQSMPMQLATARMPRLGELLAQGEGAGGVVSNAQLAAGNDSEAILDRSRALKQRMNAGDYDAGLEMYKQQPIDGCTSIMNMARTAAGFNPLEPALAENVEKFNDYTRRLVTAPFFNLGLSDTQTQERESEDWDVLINAMVETFEGVEASDKAKITKGLKQLASAAASRQDTKNTQTLFVQNVLQSTGPRIDCYVYYSKVTMEESTSKGATSKQTTFTVSRSNLIFRTADWPHFAEKVWQRQVTVVDDWLDDNTTEPGAEPVNLCLGAAS